MGKETDKPEASTEVAGRSEFALLCDWEPIATAPKDGREILTYSKKWGVKQLCWKSINYRPGSHGAALPTDQQGAWVLFNDNPNEMGCFNPTVEITEWMPVPLHS